MIERFPYGRAPFWLLVLALSSTCALLLLGGRDDPRRAALTFALFAPNHLPAYSRVTPAFERKHGLRVTFQRVPQRALQTRLQNAMLAGTDVPDIVELPEGALTFFTRGPLEDVGFLDLTERLEREGYRRRLVESRLSLWSSRGRVFALPHDVHPVMLAYRADLVEALGIDVNRLTTWEEFTAAGRRVVKDLDGDGVPDRYMLDLPLAATWGITLLLRQRGVGLFDEQGRVAFNDPKTVDTIIWYLHQTVGKDRIAFECGEGQPLMKAMQDGLVLFYMAPDWRTFVIEQEGPKLAGKMKLMPLPAWEPGGRRTSVWGGTGLAIARRSPHVELAWEFAKLLYFDKNELGQRFLGTNIIPPLRDAWDLPEFKRRKPFYGGQALGEMFAALAPETPPSWNTAYSKTAEAKLNAVFLRAVEHYRSHGDAVLKQTIESELSAAEHYLNVVMARNVLAKR